MAPQAPSVRPARLDTSGTLAALQTDVTDAGTGGTVDPTPSDTTGGTALAKVKAFVSDVRTWGTVIEAEIGTQGDAFSMQVDLASTAADSSMDFLVGAALGAALDVAGMRATGSTDTDLSAYAVGLAAGELYPGSPADPQFTAGTVASSGGVITLSGGVINGVTVNMSVLLPEDGTTASTFNLGITSATFRSTDTDVDINSGTITANLASPYTVDWAALDAGTAADPDISGGSINLDISLTQKIGMDTMMQPVPLDAPVTFAGNMSATLTNPTTDSMGNINWITPSSLTLGGNISDTAGNSFDASFTVNITNAGSFTPVGELPMGTAKVGMVAWTYMGDTFTLTSPDYTVTVQRNSGTGNATVTIDWGYYLDSYSLGGPFADINAAVNAYISGALPYYYSYFWIDGEGEYYADLNMADFSMAGSADGTLIEPEFVLEDASNWLDGTVGLNFTLQLAGLLPEASVNINGDRTGFEAGTATITIAYGAQRQIVIDGSFTTTNATGDLTITNQDGVVMSLKNGDFNARTGDITYNGSIYGSVTQLGNGLTKITYIDGTFETL